MGIDIYLWWKGQTPAELEAQAAGFSVVTGEAGYLKYIHSVLTRYLVAEADKTGRARIPAKVLRERLPRALKLVTNYAQEMYRRTVPKESPEVQALVGFVELAEKMEAETGQTCTVEIQSRLAKRKSQ